MMTIPIRPLSLQALEGNYAVCRLAHDALIPAWAAAEGLFSITRTRDELSIVCSESLVPADIRCERGWRCLRIVGTMAFTEVGVLSALITPLARSGISVFAISTFDTDYLLVKETDWDETLAQLSQVGHEIIREAAA